LNEANNKFTPYFFSHLGKPLEEVAQQKSMLERLSSLSANVSDLKKQFLKMIQPEGQETNLKTQEQIDKKYEQFNEDIEARNKLLNADTKTKEELQRLQQQIKDNETIQAALNNELEKLKETTTRPLTKPGATIDTSDPGVILHTTTNQDVAKMKILVPDSTPK
jgi:DNA repair exonuclease SbcCD ATPase subunit